MDIGKIPENILKRSVFKQIRHRRPEVVLHPGVGEDCSGVETAPGESWCYLWIQLQLQIRGQEPWQSMLQQMIWPPPGRSLWECY